MNQVFNVYRLADIGTEPVTLADAKEKLRVTFSDDDTEITKLITRARKFVENYCNISIVYQRIRTNISYESTWPLPYGPVIGIESVEGKEATQGSGPATYATSEASWDIDGDEFNPATCDKTRVTYTAGMSTVPDDLKEVILETISFLYENRGADEKTTGVLQILKNAENYQRKIWI